MTRIPVHSSRVKSIGFAEGILEVEFCSGGVYQYSPVNAAYYVGLVNSPTIGKDIQGLINDKSVTCKKISK